MTSRGVDTDALEDMFRVIPCVVQSLPGFNLTCRGSAMKKHPACVAAAIVANRDVVLRALGGIPQPSIPSYRSRNDGQIVPLLGDGRELWNLPKGGD